jgi:DNA-binding transcriptional MerR regulator
MIDDDTQRRLIRQWQETGLVLKEIRRHELAAMQEEVSRQATLDMLDLASTLPDDPRRELYSGLAEMQRLFAKLRDRG